MLAQYSVSVVHCLSSTVFVLHSDCPVQCLCCIVLVHIQCLFSMVPVLYHPCPVQCLCRTVLTQYSALGSSSFQISSNRLVDKLAIHTDNCCTLIKTDTDGGRQLKVLLFIDYHPATQACPLIHDGFITVGNALFTLFSPNNLILDCFCGAP